RRDRARLSRRDVCILHALRRRAGHHVRRRPLVEVVSDRSARILDAAIELAEAGGFDQVKAREVAARAGVTLRTLYRRFRSKEEILAAALARSVGAVEEQARALAGRGPEERLVALFRLMTRALVEKPHLARAVIRAMTSGVTGTAPPVLAYQGRTSA